MYFLEAFDIYDVAQPLHICSQIIGLTSFKISKKNGSFHSSLNWFNILSIGLTTLLNSTFTILVVFTDIGKWEVRQFTTTEIFEDIMSGVIFSFLVVTIISNLWTFAMRKDFSRIFALIYEIDEELAKLKYSVNFKRHKKIIIGFVGLSEFLLIYIMITSYIIQISSGYFRMDLTLMFVICVAVEHNVFLIFHMVFMMITVRMRYEKVNDFLTEMHRSINVTDLKKKVEELNKASLLHDKLADVVERINKCYGLPVSFILEILNPEFYLNFS